MGIKLTDSAVLQNVWNVLYKSIFYIISLYGCCFVCECDFFLFFLITVILHSDFFAGKRISALATESYNSSVNYNRQKPSVIFCVQFSTFLYKCAIFYHFMNKPDQRDGCKRFVILLLIDCFL